MCIWIQAASNIVACQHHRVAYGVAALFRDQHRKIYETRALHAPPGNIRRDHPVEKRRNAADDLRHIDADVVIDVQPDRAEAA